MKKRLLSRRLYSPVHWDVPEINVSESPFGPVVLIFTLTTLGSKVSGLASMSEKLKDVQKGLCVSGIDTFLLPAIFTSPDSTITVTVVPPASGLPF